MGKLLILVIIFLFNASFLCADSSNLIEDTDLFKKGYEEAKFKTSYTFGMLLLGALQYIESDNEDMANMFFDMMLKTTQESL